MCGIIGVTLDDGSVVPLLIEGLRRLEYRGYDSVGLAVLDGEKGLSIVKAAGDIDSFTRRFNLARLRGPVGIGHTRWATHGPPNDINAHPHSDCTGSIALVHNGVIRNYASLGEYLRRRGHRVKSETDTELVAHLIEEELSKGKSFIDALAGALSRLDGSYALAILYRGEPDRIYFAKMRSPLLLAVGDRGNAVASDITALLEVSRRIIPLEDGEFGYITPRSIAIYRLLPGGGHRQVPREEIEARAKHVEWTPEAASRGGYPHFMIKEIYEQPQAVMETYNGNIDDPRVAEAGLMIAGAGLTLIVAAGTSYHAGLVLSYHLARYGIPSIPVVASEFKQYKGIAGEDTVVVAVSQSGETYDTLEAVRSFKEQGARVVGVTNVLGSALDRESSLSLYTRAGPEIGVAATKTYLAQVTLLSILAVRAGQARGALGEGEARGTLEVLARAPDVTARAVSSGEPAARGHASRVEGSMYILGRGLGAHLALEAALKVKEIAYAHAEAYPAGESKHGPIALVEDGFPVYIVATGDSPEVTGNAVEMKARGARVTLVKPADLELDVPAGISVLNTPPVGGRSVLEPFSLIPFFQLLSYYAAVARGYNPDKPRNLAKTVTVE